MTMKSLYYLGLGIIILLTSCGDNDSDYDASGVFEVTEVIVSSKGNGEIKELQIVEGDAVDPSISVGYIDTTQLNLTKLQHLANQRSTNSRILDDVKQLASLRQQLENLNRERIRHEELVNNNAATKKQLDDINYQIDVLEKQILATQESISNTNNSLVNQSNGINAQLAQIQDQINNCIIYSPIKGIVLSKYAEQGEFATPGRALFKVGNIKEMRLRTYITADQLTTIKLGQTVKVYADLGEADRREFNGVISWISNEAEFTPKTIQTRNERSNLVYAVKIDVKNDDGIIKRGMYGEVKF